MAKIAITMEKLANNDLKQPEISDFWPEMPIWLP